MFNSALSKIIATTLLVCVSIASYAAEADKKQVLDIEHWNTDNGSKVFFVASHELPMIDIKVIFDAGSARDGKQYGLANFTTSMLEEGTTQLNADEIAERFDDVGAVFSHSTSRDSASFSLRSLTDAKLLKGALSNYTSVISEASFPLDAFERVKQQILQAIEYEQQDPNQLANKALYHVMYGDYPYGHTVYGNKQTIEQLQLADLISFYNRYYVAANATIAIVGDVEREQAEVIANYIVAKLGTGQTADKFKQPVYDPSTLQQHVVFPSSQTYIRLGEFGIAVNDPDYFSLYVGNYILGGGSLVSRLFKEVRDERGLTYSVYSHFSPMINTGPFSISLQSRNDVADQAIAETKNIIDEFIGKGVTDNELKLAKQNIIGSFNNRLDSNAAIASNIARLGFYDLPLDYFDNYRDNIAAVTKQSIQESFTKVINPKQLVTVTVGPAKQQVDANMMTVQTSNPGAAQ